MSNVVISRKLFSVVYRQNVNIFKSRIENVSKTCYTNRTSRLHSSCIKTTRVNLRGVALGFGLTVACVEFSRRHIVCAEHFVKSSTVFDQKDKPTEKPNESALCGESITDHNAKNESTSSEVDEESAGINGHPENEEGCFDWPQLLEIISPYWKRLLFAVGSAFAVAVINIEIPSFLGKLVDTVTSHLMTLGSSASQEASAVFVEKLREPATKLVLLYLAQALGTFCYIYNLSVIGEGLAKELRTRLYASLLSQEITFFDSHMTGEVVSRLTADIQEFKSSFKQCVSQGLRSISQTLGCLISLYFVSKEMTVTVIAIVPAIILLGTLFTRGLRKLSRKAQIQLSESSGHAEETLSNIRTVKAFAMEEQELLKFKQKAEELRNLNVQLGAGIGLFQAGSNLFLNGIVLGVMYTGGKLIAAQKLSSGDLMSFLVASQTIQRSLANMSLIFGQYVRGIGAGTRVFQYINLNKNANVSSVREEMGLVSTHIEGDIEFHNVTFSYPTRPQKIVLKEFSLKLPKGKMVAVVGASGSGKSTLVNIIEGFYPLQQGRITIDGNPVNTLNTKWLRGEAIGIINQEPVLFATTIMENIRYGKPSATDEEVIEAAKRANAYEFIKDFPEGFNTKLGERGVTVSGGQKQRLAIARALIKEPKILLLDESTSALDADSERVVQNALDTAVQGRTVMVIAHRLSTIKNADMIAVMSHGAIVEMGTHDSLMQRKGFYYNLVKQQEFLSKPQ